MLEGILSGAIAFFVPLAAFGKMNIVQSGQVLGYYDFGMFVFALVVIIVQLRLGLEICYWTGIEIFCFILSFGPGLWFLWYVFSSQPNLVVAVFVSSYQIYGSYNMMADELSCWCTVLLSSVIALAPVLVFLAVKTFDFPTRSDIGREISGGYVDGIRQRQRTGKKNVVRISEDM